MTIFGWLLSVLLGWLIIVVFIAWRLGCKDIRPIEEHEESFYQRHNRSKRRFVP